MVTREKIREGIMGELDMWLPLDCPQRETRLINMTNSVYEKLHKQDVVIKVERELPKNPVKITQYLGLSKEEATSRQLERDCFMLVIQIQMLKAGYVAVEPLVKDD